MTEGGQLDNLETFHLLPQLIFAGELQTGFHVFL